MTEPQDVGVTALSDATRLPAVIWLDDPSGATSDTIATTCASLLVEPSQIVAAMGPDSA